MLRFKGKNSAEPKGKGIEVKGIDGAGSKPIHDESKMNVKKMHSTINNMMKGKK